MKTREQTYREKLEEIVKWIESSSDSLSGEAAFNARMLMESILLTLIK